MSRIRDKNSRTEITVEMLLLWRECRYRLDFASLPGKPDFLLPRYQPDILMNGCFRHWHNCHLFK